MPTSIQSSSGERFQVHKKTGAIIAKQTVSNWNYNRQVKPDRSRTPKPKGLLLPKSYSMSSDVTEQPVHVTYDWFRTTNPSISSDVIFYHDYEFSNATSGVSMDFSAAMLDQAVTQALLRLKNQKINLGAALGEAGKTVSMVNSLVSDVYKGYKALRKLDPKGAARAFSQRGWKNIPDRWLEYQYGLKPLVQDIDGALQHLAQQPVQNYRSIVRGRMVDDSYSVDWLGVSFPGISRGIRRKEEVAVILAYIPYSMQTIRNVQAGANPAATAWELTPFSFVLDWALPIGDYLSVFDAAWGWTYLYGCRSQFIKSKFHLACKERVSGVNTYRVLNARSGSYERVKFVRSLYSGSPLPMLPRWKNPVSTAHMANGLSLLASLLK